MRPLFFFFAMLLRFFAFFSRSASSNKDNEPASLEIELNDTIVRPDFIRPEFPVNAYFVDVFLDQSGVGKKWIVSEAKKDGVDANIEKYNGEWGIDISDLPIVKNDYGLIAKSKARHHAIAAKFARPFSFQNNKPLVFQYEVKVQKIHECGGAYVKLLSKESLKLRNFNDRTQYTVMFGPDKCGYDSKFHFIIRFKNPNTGLVTEHKAKQPEKSIGDHFSDKKYHLYTLVLNPDNSYKIYMDQVEASRGNLLTTFEPPIVPPKEIDDPKDQKPSDWEDMEKIVDPNAKKPDDWDETAPEYIDDQNTKKPSDWLDNEPEYVHDETKTKPRDWDEEMDGTWEAPLIKNKRCSEVSGCGKWTPPHVKNPQFKGKWKPPLISNPKFKGEWKPRKIKNPDYFEMSSPFAHLAEIGAIGLELWTMTDSTLFDDFLVIDDKNAADKFAKETWAIKSALESDNKEKRFFDDWYEKLSDVPQWMLVATVVVATIVFLSGCFCLCRYCTKKPYVPPVVVAENKEKVTDENNDDDSVYCEDNQLNKSLPQLDCGDSKDNDEENERDYLEMGGIRRRIK